MKAPRCDAAQGAVTIRGNGPRAGRPESAVCNRFFAASMPTVLRLGRYRFYFYSHEPNEPPHIHVDRDELSAKFWVDPVRLASNLGLRARELAELERIVQQHQ